MNATFRRAVAALTFCFVASVGAIVFADEPTEKTPPASTSGSATDLANEQQQLADKYKRFEEVMMRMAELTAPSDPKRAALLRKAVAESKHQLIGAQLDKLAEILGQDRLSVALSNQNDVNKDLAELLELLLSEERDKSLKDERARYKEQIRRVAELINKERQLQGQTSGGGEMQGLAEGQQKVADDAGKLAEDMKPKDDKASQRDDKSGKKDSKKDAAEGEESAEDKDSSPNDSTPGDGGTRPGKSGKPPGDKPSEQDKAQESGEDSAKDSKDDAGKEKTADQAGDKDKDKSDAEKNADENQEGAKPSESGKPSDGKPQEQGKKKKQSGQQGQKGQQGESQDQESEQDESAEQPKDASESARKRVQAAQEKMEAARQKLEKAHREGAVEDQEAAIRELEQAKAELEEILRQLREEELERMLAMLEARFRKMLQAQVEVYEGTKRVDQTPAAERDRDDEIEAGRLSRKESQIVLEAESALAILHEEGSAVAFPEAVEQMREDMEQIVVRLGHADVGELTQSIEEDVITALEEMIESLQKAQQDMEKQKQQQQQAQEGEQQEPPLIDSLAELRMIRSLQMRINMRTKRLSRLVEGDLGQADKPDILEQLQRLAEREESVFRVTRDIVTGKNR
ncbi:MAG TPA: hypothetical protein VGN12_13495 [Pirellulales bacterium]|jgi:hypothetical protein